MEYQGIERTFVLNRSMIEIIFLFVSFANIQNAAGGSIESDPQWAFHLLSSIVLTSVAETADVSAQVKSTNSGIVQIPVPKSSSIYRTGREKKIKTDAIIDTVRILDSTITYSRSDLSNLKDNSQSGLISIMLVGDNPRVVVSSRLKGNNDWGRYQLDSLPVNKEESSSLLTNGLIASGRMAL